MSNKPSDNGAESIIYSDEYKRFLSVLLELTNTQPSAKVHGMKGHLAIMVGIRGNECLGLYGNAKITKRNRL